MGDNEVYLNDSLFTFDITGTYDPPPPPNCKEYYKEIGVCFPDNICQKIKQC